MVQIVSPHKTNYVKKYVLCAPIDLLPGIFKILKFTMAVMYLRIDIVREVGISKWCQISPKIWPYKFKFK
jgi:hypothetical protein